MSLARPCLALVLGLTFVAAAAGCGGSKGPGSGGSGSGGSTTGSTTTTTTTTTSTTAMGTGGSDPTVPMCEACLDTTCKTEKAACNSDCYAIQGCLDAVCANLSETGAATEGDCQTYCESLHPNGKAPLLAYVNCVQGSSCMACAGAPYDYEQCAAAQTAGACKSERDACTASSDCTTYQGCAGSCATFTDCQACASGTGPAAGEKLYEALQLCIDDTCLATYWLPDL